MLIRTSRPGAYGSPVEGRKQQPLTNRQGWAMRLVDALQELRLDAEIAMEGRWARIQGERCFLYVVEMSRHRGFFTWCDDPEERAVEFHSDPVDAITSGLRRAKRLSSGTDGTETGW